MKCPSPRARFAYVPLFRNAATGVHPNCTIGVVLDPVKSSLSFRMSANSHHKLHHKTLLRFFAAAVRARRWISAEDSEFETAFEQSLQASDNCDCLLALLSSPCFKLSECARRALQQVTQRGITLRLTWPRAWSDSIEEWIGPRLYFSASRNFSPVQQYFGLVSSQIGRNGSKQPNWPALVDAALKFSHPRSASTAHRAQHKSR